LIVDEKGKKKPEKKTREKKEGLCFFRAKKGEGKGKVFFRLLGGGK